MPSETAIVNRALRLIKTDRIDSLTDGSKNANIANDVYTQVRDELLREFNWGFATKRVKLARSATAPIGYDYGYVLPSDWIRTISVHDNDNMTGTVRYKEEQLGGQNCLLASVENCYLRYVSRVEDPNLMPEDFHSLLSHSLAMAMPGISNISAAEWEVLTKETTRKRNRSKSADAMGSYPERRPRGSWADSRGGWRNSAFGTE